MEKELNIAAILKDKPLLLKFYSPTFGRITFNGVHKGKVYFFSEDTNAHSVKQNGKMYDGGDCIIFPSKEMRDWDKFAWKKGDVLVMDGCRVVFDKWLNDDYTKFNAVHLITSSGVYYNKPSQNSYSPISHFITKYWRKMTDAETKIYMDSLEIECGGKLNLATLEIEKQPEFKDGDIVCISGMGYLAYGIVKSIDNSSKKLEYYVLNDMSTLKFEDWLSFKDKQIHPITETQQIILFEALAKKGKAWDAEKKMLVDLPKKCEFKPFDKCVWKMQGIEGSIWQASFISYVDEYGAVPMGVDDLSNLIILPYNEETAHLLGTTDDWEGGEHD